MGLAVPSSDVDIVVRGMDKENLITSRYLQEMDWVQSLQCIPRTAFPLIRSYVSRYHQAQGSLITVDITFETSKHTGLNTKESLLSCKTFSASQTINARPKAVSRRKGSERSLRGRVVELRARNYDY